MQHLLIVFYAFVFSFGHSEAPHHAEVPRPSEVVNASTYAPTRQELARARAERLSSYSETACVSCRPTNVSYRVR